MRLEAASDFSVMALSGAAQPGGLLNFLPFAIILVIFYVLILMPMQRRQKKVQEFQSALKVGDKVTMRVRATSGTHGFTLFGPDGNVLVPDSIYSAGGAPESYDFTVTKTGTYTFFCTQSNCGEGHTGMAGTFDIH
jgi:hypothetical protein